MRFPRFLPLLFAASGTLLVADAPSGINPPTLMPKIAKVARVMTTSEAQKSEVAKQAGAPKVESPYFGDILRLPFQSHRVYKIQVVPGCPVILELPAGEAAKNMYWDMNWWTMESTPGSGRVVIDAKQAMGIVGRKTNAHIETVPGDFRISISLEAVSEAYDVPAAWQLYLDKQDPEAAMYQKAKARAQAELEQDRARMESRMQEDLGRWKREALGKARAAYKFDKDMFSKVVDDGVQTFLYAPAESEQATIKFMNRDGKEEVLDLEFSNGMYTINRVLQPKEEFRAALGKASSTIKLK